MKARLYEKYVKEVVPALKERRKYTNLHQVPRMQKIVVNMGVGEATQAVGRSPRAQGWRQDVEDTEALRARP